MNNAELLATAREYAIELLFALDTNQTAHQPRPHAEIVELLHGLLGLLDDDEPDALPASRLPDAVNDFNFTGGTAA